MEKFLKVIDMLPTDYQGKCRKLYLDNKAIFDSCPGSSHNHQAWPGGYIDHMVELQQIARTTYTSLSQIRPLPFSLDDAILCLFLHDLEKPWKYGNVYQFSSDEQRLSFVYNKALEYGITWTDDRWNAIKYAHGEGKDYSATTRIQTPLAAFVHCCDVTSARIWFDKPGATNALSEHETVVS